MNDFSVSLIQIKISDADGLAHLWEIIPETQPETDVLVFPELWSGLANGESERCFETLSEICVARCVYAVSGGIPWTEEERRFVRTWMLDDMGNCFASYDKAHLSSRLGEDEIYSPGDGPGIFNIKEATCSALSGHDILFPEFCRQISLAGTQIFFVSANWPKEFGAMWEPVIRSVAFTNQCYVVACNGSGNSAVISPYGEIIAAMGAEEGVLSVSLKLSEVSRCRKNIPLDRDRRGELYAIFP